MRTVVSTESNKPSIPEKITVMFKVAKLEGVIRIINCFLGLSQHTVPSLHHMIHNNVTTLFLQKYDIHNKSGILSIKLLYHKYVFL